MNLGIIRQVFVHCLYLYYKKIMWNCAFAVLNRLWDVPCLNERIFKRVSLNHFIVITSSQAVYPYIMEWEVEKILQLLSQDCRCKWQTNDQWVCHDAAGAGGGSGGGSAPGQAAEPILLLSQEQGTRGHGTALAPGIRHLPEHGPRDLKDHSPLQSPTREQQLYWIWRHTLIFSPSGTAGKPLLLWNTC